MVKGKLKCAECNVLMDIDSTKVKTEDYESIGFPDTEFKEIQKWFHIEHYRRNIEVTNSCRRKYVKCPFCKSNNVLKSNILKENIKTTKSKWRRYNPFFY